MLTRLDGGKLSLLAIAYLLLETPAGGGWSTLREALVHDLATHPNDAVQVFNVAASALEWPPLATEEPRREGPPHAPTFTGLVRITPPGAATPIEASAAGSSMKLAQHRSAVALLAACAEVDPPSFEGNQQRGVPPRISGKARPMPEDSDPIAWLHIHASRFHLKQPRFTSGTMVGGRHHVVVRYNGVEGEGRAATKQAAKREACAKVRERILAGPQDEALGAS